MSGADGGELYIAAGAGKNVADVGNQAAAWDRDGAGHWANPTSSGHTEGCGSFIPENSDEEWYRT